MSFLEPLRRRRRLVAPDEDPDLERRYVLVGAGALALLPLALLLTVEDFLTTDLRESLGTLSLLVCLAGLVAAVATLRDPMPSLRFAGLAAAILVLDLVLIGGGHGFAFVELFLFPILMAGLLGSLEGALWSLLLGASATLLFYLPVSHPYPADLAPRFIVSFFLVTLLAATLEASRERLRRRLATEKATLEELARQVKTLRGLLPYCPSCKKVKDDRGYWHDLEEYVLAHSEVTFSHGLCPRCLSELYPELAADRAD